MDGTLLLSGGATTRCIWRAAEATFGRTLERCPLTAGLLDPQLFLSIASHCRIDNATEFLARYKATYLAELEAELSRTRDRVRVMPGIIELLEQLEKSTEVVAGLLTGNFKDATLLKLRVAGLDRFGFPVSAFAEDGTTRDDLVDAAIKHFAQSKGETISPSQIIIVGDTPRDISTARATGCKVLAVATGSYSLEQLRAEHPDVLVKDLLDPRRLYDLISRLGSAD